MDKMENIKPKSNFLKRIYLSFIMFFLGRAFRSSNIDKNIKKQILQLPENFSFCLKIERANIDLIIEKKNNRFIIVNSKSKRDEDIDLFIIFKNIERAFLVFTFQISAFLSYAQNGLIIKGDLQKTMIIMKILTLLEVYLLPKFIAKRVIKRYPKWIFFYKLFNRFLIYFRIFIGI
ncbi:MAG TPA: hypothetical protein PLE45_10890 [Spirochaetota bacterium]|nr:hypothetical protein [Spirochaetota bacterium]HOL57697.1 hypothetical protein [Spirochaetota bacterium]HPP05259.1 hypothetical protein [Spirochaetota bacterium]